MRSKKQCTIKYLMEEELEIYVTSQCGKVTVTNPLPFIQPQLLAERFLNKNWTIVHSLGRRHVHFALSL